MLFNHHCVFHCFGVHYTSFFIYFNDFIQYFHKFNSCMCNMSKFVLFHVPITITHSLTTNPTFQNIHSSIQPSRPITTTATHATIIPTRPHVHYLAQALIYHHPFIHTSTLIHPPMHHHNSSTTTQLSIQLQASCNHPSITSNHDQPLQRRSC